MDFDIIFGRYFTPPPPPLLIRVRVRVQVRDGAFGVKTGADFDHHAAVPLFMPTLGLAKLGRLLGVTGANKVRPLPLLVRENFYSVPDRRAECCD